MTTDKSDLGALSRRTFIRLSQAVPLMACPGVNKAAAAAPGGPVFIETRSKVPDPHVVNFQVQYPGKEPLRLVGHMWFHSDAVRDGERCPAIVELHPYRRRDGTMALDSQMYPWFAFNKYLCLRVDLQGSGDSDGVMTDEYSDEELSYCCQIIEQIAAHPLCNGHVGLMGKSWSAINTLMVAARKDVPAALKAVVAANVSDDRYSDDVHYMGGAMLHDNLTWPGVMWGFLAQPPDPAIVGDRWQELWRQRIDGARFWFETWSSHQTRDAYWRLTSVRDQYQQLKVPVFVSSGWQDHYVNTVGRLTAGVDAAGGLAAGVVGPWGHDYPFSGAPGPRLDWLHYLVTHWWDRWLKGKTPDVAQAWPQLLVWLNESSEPSPSACTPEVGRWVAETGQWTQRVQEQLIYPAANGQLQASAEAAAVFSIPSALTIGREFIDNGSMGACGVDDLPGDQTAIDRQALTFDGAAWTEDFDCYGEPVLRVNFSSSSEQAVLVVRLCEISPLTGASHLVSYRFFNLCYHSGDMAQPQLLKPGVIYTAHIPLNFIGHTFKRGWRLRLSLSTSLFPVLWQAHGAGEVKIFAASVAGLQAEATALTLPGRRPRAEDAGLAARLASSQPNAGTSVDPQAYVPVLEEGRQAQASSEITELNRDGRKGIRIHKHTDRGRYLYGGPLEKLWADQVLEQTYEVFEDDPGSMVCTTSCISLLEREQSGWWTKAATTTKIWTGRDSFGRAVFNYEATIATFIRDDQGHEQPFAEKSLHGSIVRTWV